MMTNTRVKNDQITVTQLTLPKGGGAIQGTGETFQANEFTGTASLTIPIPTTPCRGFEPQLSVDYHSGAGNGMFGLGFGLSIPNIARKTSKGLPHYDDSDTFLLSNAEDLVPDSDGQRVETRNNIPYKVMSYHPRIEGAFAKIEHWIDQQSENSHWRVVSNDNITSLFGTTEQAKIVDPEDRSHIFQWLLAETFDAGGNHIVYEYTRENLDNIASALSEMNRTQTAHAYIRRIAYGNAEPFQEGQTTSETWHFEVIFDYGEYDLAPTNPTPYTPVRPWAARPDPFSTYQAGFEIRTHRLCRNILMFHRFEELGPDPALVHVTSFHYQTMPTVTLMQAVEFIGYRFEHGSYQTQRLPPIEFSYTGFQPAGHSFEVLQEDTGQRLPGLNLFPDYQLIDLYGEGVPGILYNDGRTTLYWEPESTEDGQKTSQPVRYTPPQAPLVFPIESNHQAVTRRLLDLTGNGRLDLVVSTSTSIGYYEANPNHTWRPFQVIPSLPTDFFNPETYLVDVTGDGLADMLLLENERIRVYSSRGKNGFEPAFTRSRQHDIPLPRPGATNEVIQFADMFGSGMQHLVHITNGRVECWPNLGYGRFGKPVLFDNAPHFGADLDASRLFLADLDGSGTADIIYAYPDRVEIFFNQSGNSFSQPFSLPLPGMWDRYNHIGFADVYGNGANCLLLSDNHSQPRHWCYDFNQGQKPYLLNAINNNRGAQSTITYCSSTKYYLADKKKGTPWIVNLPFPVQVVEKTEHIDLISQTRLVTTYSYHHGYYDGVEREFRGFGLVERQDAETLLADVQPTDVPPLLTRTWYHTGAWQQDGPLSQQYAHEYFQQDIQAHLLPDSVFESAGWEADAQTWREAFRALKGKVLREEVSAPTASPALPAQQQDAPYIVTETNYLVRLLQPRGRNRYGVYFVYPQETLTSIYERTPADPRIQHSFVLKVDAYGNVLRACTVTYGRRQGSGAALPDQLALKVTADEDSFINQTEGMYLLGIPQETKTYEIKGLSLAPGKLYFTFEEISGYLEQVIGTATSQLLNWQRYYYWSPAQNQPSVLGQVSPQALLARTEQAVVAAELIEQTFEGALAKDALESLLSGEGGYQQDTDKMYWWNPGLTESYLDASSFFLPKATTDQYGHVTTYAYDQHRLLPVEVTDALHNQTVAEAIDYQALAVQCLRDMNGAITEVLFDPLGMVVVSSHYGSEDGQATGFMALKDYQQQSAPGMDDVIARAQTYLQGASSYFYYDFFSWVDHQIPVHAVSLIATNYQASGVSPIQIHISYNDGFGREQQTVTNVEPGEAHVITPDGTVATAMTSDRWLTSGRVAYNNKGAPIKQYEPFYSATSEYVDTPHLNAFGVSSTLFYDPAGRLIRVNTPKGGFMRAVFGAWTETFYDENDTIKDSAYYKQNSDNQARDFQLELQALQKASLFHNTPKERVLDNLGRTIQEIQKQEGMVAKNAFTSIGLTDAQSQALWQDLQTRGLLDFRGALTWAFQPDLPGFNLGVSASFAAYEQQILATLRAIQQTGELLTTRYDWDIQGYQLASADHRLSALGKENVRAIYTLTGEALKTVSVDAGVRWHLRGVMGNPIYTKDSRQFEVRTQYDALRRPVAVQVTGGDGKAPLNQITERMVYGDSIDAHGQLVVTNPEKMNLRGHLYIHYDQAGVVTNSTYNILGLPLSISRQLHQDYKQEASWGDISAPALGTRLQSTIYQATYRYDALGRVLAATNPDGNISEPTYHISGRLNQLQVRPQAGGQPEIYIQSIDYNARGQRERIVYGNGMTTRYEYEPTTFRLAHLLTTRSSDSQKLQDLTYTYDPVGNISHIVDGAQEPVFYANQQVKPEFDYTYDALYRLITATGREHSGLLLQAEQQGGFDENWLLSPQPLNNGQALENYTQHIAYDAGGNLYRIQHQGVAERTRAMTVSASSNRAVDSQLTDQPAAVDSCFDGNGNQIRMSGVQAITWNYRDNIASAIVVQRQDAPSDGEYYIYDGAGNRIRKVTERYGNSGTIARVEETISLGTLEIRRVMQGGTLIEERHTLRVMDDRDSVAHRLDWKAGQPSEVNQLPQIRYQLVNHLGSVALEVDADGQIISYEEYFPYGGTALISGQNAGEVNLKQYRYAGKERDSMTGFYYYGARYYAPWLGRWMSPDPSGQVDGLNLYTFVGNNPITYTDTNGRVTTLHWNVESKNTAGLQDEQFIKDVVTFLDKGVDKEGTVAFLTEVMGSVTNATFNNLLSAINKKSDYPQWEGRLLPAGVSEGGSRSEKIAILHINLKDVNYWQLVADNPYSVRLVKDATLTKTHQQNSRFPVGVDATIKTTGGEETISIGGFHNLGPSTGASTEASKIRNAIKEHGINVVTGDWNTQPAPSQRRILAASGRRTRASRAEELTNYDNVATSRGGSYYDYTQVFNADFGGRELYVKNTTGVKRPSSDHNQISATIGTRRKRQRQGE